MNTPNEGSNILEIIEYYLNQIKDDENHRYSSWDNCRSAFLYRKKDQFHALELGFYLASWGMYRGSGGLLQKNHKIHQQAADLFYDLKFSTLICNEENEVSTKQIPLILELKQALIDIYSNIDFVRGIEQKQINPTDTLVTKIMLGLFACMPAFDQYFISGLKEKNIKASSLNPKSIQILFDFAATNQEVIKECQKLVLKKQNQHYPVMKIIDIYFWQTGYDAEMEKERKKKQIKLITKTV